MSASLSLLASLAMLPVEASAQGLLWWDDGWSGRAQIRLDNSARAETLVDFPVLVVLTEGQTFEHAQALPQGADLRFVDDDGLTLLSYDIEQWDEAGVSHVWVRVPRVEAASVDRIWMYWGQPAAASGEDEAGTWSSAYVAVWHLDPSLSDATSHNYDGAATGTTEAPGLVGRARSFDGNNDQIAIGTEAPFDFTGPFTISAWVRTAGFAHDGWDAVITKGDQSWRLHRCGGSVQLAFSVTLTGGWADRCSSLGVTDDAWHQVVGVFDTATQSHAIYVDGALDGIAAEVRLPSITNDPVWIGNNIDFPDRSFSGLIDEVRVQSVARSEAWIEAEHANLTGGLVSWCGPWSDDDDGDGVCNGEDLCPEGNDGFDSDWDALADDCDPCPALAFEQDSDGDGYFVCQDCADEDEAIHPGALEIAGDGLDNDCLDGDTPAEPDTDTDTDSDSDSDTDTDVDTDSDADSDSDTDADTDADADPLPPGLDTASPPLDGPDRLPVDPAAPQSVGCSCGAPGGPRSAVLLLALFLASIRGRRSPRVLGPCRGK